MGDTLTLRVTQGTEDEFFDLRVVGITDGQQYSLQPSIFVPFYTWDRIRPKSEAEVNSSNPVANVILVKLDDPAQVEEVSQRLVAQVDNIETATMKDAIQALPGYSAQQSTLNTQGGFTLFIGILVIGGFFQIQILQKVSQIGVLKAIGTANPVVAACFGDPDRGGHSDRSGDWRAVYLPVFAHFPTHRPDCLQRHHLRPGSDRPAVDRAAGRAGFHPLCSAD